MDALADTFESVCKVFAVIPEYHQVRISDDAGHHYAITGKTEGVNYADLKLGQQLKCTITKQLPRVLRAEIIL